MDDCLGRRVEAHPFGEIRLRHRLAVGRRVECRRRHRVDQNAVALQLFGERDRDRRDRRLARRVGRHAGALARVEPGRAVTLTMRPAVPDASIDPRRSTAAEEGGFRVGVHHLVEDVRPSLADRRHGESAGKVDRGPKAGHGGIEAVDRCRVADVDIGRKLHPVMTVKGKIPGHGRMAGRHMADSAFFEQFRQHRAAERAGAARHHNRLAYELRSHGSVHRDLDEIGLFAASGRAAGLRTDRRARRAAQQQCRRPPRSWRNQAVPATRRPARRRLRASRSRSRGSRNCSRR